MGRNYANTRSNKNKGNKHTTAFEGTVRITKALNKHGQLNLKKKNKQERRELIANCMHHVQKKNGDVKMRLIENNDATYTCRLCGARIPFNGATKKELKEMCNAVTTELNFAQFIMQSGGIGDQKTASFFAKVKYELAQTPKIVTRVQKTYKKKTDTKKSKKNRGYDSKYGSKYGQWSEN